MGYGIEHMTKNRIRVKCKEILDSYDEGEYVSDEDYCFLCAVYTQSQDSKEIFGCGLEKISVTREHTYYNRCFQVHRKDGSVGIYGFMSCIYPRGVEMAYNSFRFAVIRQMFLFGVVNGVTEDEEVNHIIPFRKLVNDFLAQKRLTISNVAIRKHPAKTGVWEIVDTGLMHEWREYHRANAKLEPVSASEHGNNM
ncbi:MAG: DUF3223 domain-containing protein [Candidatus Micrarchaeia archaeon]